METSSPDAITVCDGAASKSCRELTLFIPPLLPSDSLSSPWRSSTAEGMSTTPSFCKRATSLTGIRQCPPGPSSATIRPVSQSRRTWCVDSPSTLATCPVRQKPRRAIPLSFSDQCLVNPCTNCAVHPQSVDISLLVFQIVNHSLTHIGESR